MTSGASDSGSGVPPLPPQSDKLDVRVVALGGGHGLAASLAAMRRIAQDLTAVVTVADNGGSSGRLRAEFGSLPPGDLRQALSALCGDDDWGSTWARVLQHRFSTNGNLDQHAVGNLLIVALWELLGDGPSVLVDGLDWVARLLGAEGRVLPMALVPLDVTATVVGADPERPSEQIVVRGQVEIATTRGRVDQLMLDPPDPPACPESIKAVQQADWVVLGPGSWFTSVIPHLLVPELRQALESCDGRTLVVLNLTAQPGETEGYAPETHLEVLTAHAPGLHVDVVLADPSFVPDVDALRDTCQAIGAQLALDDVAVDPRTPRHDPDKLARAFSRVLQQA